MSFCPVDQLQKYGWENGRGLGRDQQGIKEAIKVKLKFDSTGVGHDPGEQFTHHWWDAAFNSAAKNIKVTENENGVEITKTGESVLSTKKHAKLLNKPGMLYGTFIKAATLTDGSELLEDKSDSSSDSDSDSDDDLAKIQSVLTDEQLFKACGGRTAHKGARHGLKLNGKLARIAQQESGHTSLNSSPAQSDVDVAKEDQLNRNQEDSSAKKKKCKKSKTESNKSCSEETIESKKPMKEKVSDKLDNGCNSVEESPDENVKIKRKKSKKSDKIDVSCDDSLDNDVEKSTKKKSKKSKKCITETNESIISEEPSIDGESTKSRKKKKSKKQGPNECCDNNDVVEGKSHNLVEIETETKVKGKKRKKSKRDVKGGDEIDNYSDNNLDKSKGKTKKRKIEQSSCVIEIKEDIVDAIKKKKTKKKSKD